MKRIQGKIIISMMVCAMIPIIILSCLMFFQMHEEEQFNDILAHTQIKENLDRELEMKFANLDNAAYSIYYNFNFLKKLQKQESINNNKGGQIISDIANYYLHSNRDNDLLSVKLYNVQNDLISYYFYVRPVLTKGVLNNYEEYVQLMKGTDAPNKQLLYKYDKNFKKEVIFYYYPIKFKGKYVGFIEFTLSAEPTIAHLENYNEFYNGQIYLVTDKGKIAYSIDSSMFWKDFSNINLKGKKVIEKRNDVLGGKIIYLYEGNPSRRVSLFITVIILILTIVLVVWSSYLLSNMITKPIITLRKKIDEIENGNYNIQVEINSEDEIGELGRSYNEMVKKIKGYIEYEIKTKLAYNQAQIGALQAQISPHFLHNTLQTISNMAITNNLDDISMICKSLSDMYRYNMNINEKFICLKREVMHLRNYMFIISKRYNNMIKFSMRLPRDMEDLMVPKLILQPIVENAVEHGLLVHNLDCKRIDISFHISREENFIKIYVKDNGRGIKNERLQEIIEHLQREDLGDYPENYESIGLDNVQKRIKLLCGNTCGLHLTSEINEGTTVTYLLPIIERTIHDENNDC